MFDFNSRLDELITEARGEGMTTEEIASELELKRMALDEEDDAAEED